MIERHQIESILKVNGVTPGSPDEEIRSVLLSARYSKNDVDTAIMVLRQNTKTKQTRVDGLHKVFRSNQALSPEEISELLGIEVEASTTSQPAVEAKDYSKLVTLLIWILSILIGIGGVLIYMYLHQLGPFHPAFL